LNFFSAFLCVTSCIALNVRKYSKPIIGAAMDAHNKHCDVGCKAVPVGTWGGGFMPSVDYMYLQANILFCTQIFYLFKVLNKMAFAAHTVQYK
jgi:hypothetical protein